MVDVFYATADNTVITDKARISASVLHDWLWRDTLLCRGTAY